jgi:hypothetical protein
MWLTGLLFLRNSLLIDHILILSMHIIIYLFIICFILGNHVMKHAAHRTNCILQKPTLTFDLDSYKLRRWILCVKDSPRHTIVGCECKLTKWKLLWKANEQWIFRHENKNNR